MSKKIVAVICMLAVVLALGAAAILLTLIAGHRAAGGLFYLALLFLAYDFLGRFIPGTLGHGGFTLSRLANHLFWSSQGLFGTTNYYDRYGKKKGYSSDGLFGTRNYYDRHGKKTGYSSKGLFGDTIYYDANGRRRGSKSKSWF